MTRPIVLSAALALLATPALAAPVDCWPYLRGPVHHAPKAQTPSPVHVHRYRLYTPAPKHYELACATPEPVGPYLTVITVDAAEIPGPPDGLTGPAQPVFAPQPSWPPERVGRAPWGAVAGGASTPAGPVPEPATWALLIAGFLGVGMGLRKARTPNEKGHGYA